MSLKDKWRAIRPREIFKSPQGSFQERRLLDSFSVKLVLALQTDLCFGSEAAQAKADGGVCHVLLNPQRTQHVARLQACARARAAAADRQILCFNTPNVSEVHRFVYCYLSACNVKQHYRNQFTIAAGKLRVILRGRKWIARCTSLYLRKSTREPSHRKQACIYFQPHTSKLPSWLPSPS